MIVTASKLLRDERGVELVEVLLVLAVFGLGGLVAMKTLRGSLQGAALEVGQAVVDMDRPGSGKGASSSGLGSASQPGAARAQAEAPEDESDAGHWWDTGKTLLRKGYQAFRFGANAINGSNLLASGIAVLGGADECHFNGQELMVVCTGMDRFIREGSSGFTLGSVYISGNGDEGTRLMAHEAKHADQTLLTSPPGTFGLPFAVEYGVADKLQGKCNVFEKMAGFADGNYRSCE